MNVKKKYTKLLLLSFPRSGSVFLNYCLQYGFKTFLVNQKPYLESFSKHLSGFELENKVQILKHHDFSAVAKHDNEDVFTIFMLRDFKECVPSHCAQEGTEDYQSYLDEYCDGLLSFRQWKNEKHVVYYEDFIKDPVRETSIIIDKCNSDYHHVMDSLSDDIDELSKQSIALKKSLGSPSLSGGKQSSFHSKKLNQKEQDAMIEHVKARLVSGDLLEVVDAYL